MLIDGSGQIKLADFGISARAERHVPGFGTPAYPAPAPWAGLGAGLETGPATDLYAAGVVFFECLTGERPHAAEPVAAIALKQVPETVRPLLTIGLSKNPDQRYQDAGSFIADLERVTAEGWEPARKERETRGLAAAAAVLIAAFRHLRAGSVGARSGAAAGGGAGGAERTVSNAHRPASAASHIAEATAEVKTVAAVISMVAVATGTAVAVTAPSSRPRPRLCPRRCRTRSRRAPRPWADVRQPGHR